METAKRYIIKKNKGSVLNPYLMTFMDELVFGALWQAILWGDAPLKIFTSVDQARKFINDADICSQENVICEMTITMDSINITPV